MALLYLVWLLSIGALVSFFSSEHVSDFIDPVQRAMRGPRISANEFIAQASMIAEWPGSSIKEELIPVMDNVSALSWVDFGRDRHGAAARIQVDVFRWLAVRKIRIPHLHTARGQFL